MISLCLSTAAILLNLAAVQAGLVSLPITRTTCGLYFDYPDLSDDEHQTQKHQNQIAFTFSHPRFSQLKRDNSNINVARSTYSSRRHPKIQDDSDDDGDDDEDVMFFSLYTAPISIGNPPLILTATVDTSWSTLFVASVNCTYDPYELHYCMIHPLYNSSTSSTYRADLTPAMVLYAGNAGLHTWGNISRDSVHVAGIEVKDQVFEEATIWHPDLSTFDEVFDTALGLSLFPTRNGFGPEYLAAPSPLQNMIEQKLLDKNIVSLKLPRTDKEIGTMVLGGLPKNVRREELVEVPLDHSKTDQSDHIWRYYTMNGWQVSVENMTMATNGSETFTTVLDKPQIAVISSSFPYIGLPDEVAAKIHEAIGLDYVFSWIHCDKRQDLPNWTITFGPGGQEITLTPWDYLLEVYDKAYRRLKCVSSFYDMGEYGDKGFIILGAPFLNGLHSVYDADRKSISFANRPL